MTRFFLIAFLIYAGGVYGQDLSELERRNGFKDIKLGADVDSVKGVKFKKDFKEKNEFPAKLYEVTDDLYARIAEVKVDRIELKAYKSKIYEISVVTDKDTRLMKALESIYGKADYDLKNETYIWNTDKLVLTFRSVGRNQLEMRYTSYLIHKRMKEDKNKKVEDIADDF